MVIFSSTDNSIDNKLTLNIRRTVTSSVSQFVELFRLRAPIKIDPVSFGFEQQHNKSVAATALKMWTRRRKRRGSRDRYIIERWVKQILSSNAPVQKSRKNSSRHLLISFDKVHLETFLHVRLLYVELVLCIRYRNCGDRSASLLWHLGSGPGWLQPVLHELYDSWFQGLLTWNLNCGCDTTCNTSKELS